jgi:hypothetical protein
VEGVVVGNCFYQVVSLLFQGDDGKVWSKKEVITKAILLNRLKEINPI